MQIRFRRPAGRIPTGRVPAARLVSTTTLAIAAGLILATEAFQGLDAKAQPPDRTEALVAITAAEDRRVSGPELLPYLSDPDPAVRGRAALALGRIGRTEDIGALVPLTADSDTEVRRWAVFALGEIEDSTAAIPLIEILQSGREPDPTVRAFAVEGLAKRGSGAEACRLALRDPVPEVRAAALFAAWRIPVPDALEEILQLTNHANPEIRWPAAYCLMRMTGAGASGRTAIPQAAPLPAADRRAAALRLQELLSDDDPRVRLQAARGLGGFDDSLTTGLLLGLSRVSDWRLRVEAVRSLAAPQAPPAGSDPQRPHHRAVPLVLLEPFLRDPNPNVRITAVEALGVLGTPKRTLPRLEQLLDDPHPRIRQVAFQSLLARRSAEGDPLPGPAAEAVERLTLRMLESRSWADRELAAEGAVLLPLEEALPILDRMLDDDPRVAKAAVGPLIERRAAIGRGTILSRVRKETAELLESSDAVLRALTIEAAGRVVADSSLSPTPADASELAALLRAAWDRSLRTDRTGDVRQAVVAVADAHVGQPGFEALLREACEDPDYLVRRAAVAALRRAGRTLPREAEPVETGRTSEDYRALLEWAESDRWAVIETEGDTLLVELFTRDAPLTCWNFARLAGEGFYDRGRWHRVVPDFVLQDGCPRGDGYGGSDREIRCEINRRRYRPGTLGMALSGKDTGSSQFFLTHSDQPHLDGGYTVFGRIVRGGRVTESVTQGSPIRSIRVVDRSR